MQPAGEHNQRWLGVNDAHQPVASGVYLLRLEAGGEVLVSKVVLLK